MDSTAITLFRVPAVFAVCLAHYVTFTAPRHGTEAETIHFHDWSDNLNWFFRKYAGWFKATYIFVGVAEIIEVLWGDASKYSVSPITVLGLALLLTGAWARKTCYKILARHFTFSVTIRKNHELITHGPYAVVRHPSYLGMALWYLGAALWHISPGSWVMESGAIRSPPIAILLGLYTLFMLGLLASLFIRAPREDKVLKQHFGEKWDDWAKRVPYLVIPGIF